MVGHSNEPWFSLHYTKKKKKSVVILFSIFYLNVNSNIFNNIIIATCLVVAIDFCYFYTFYYNHGIIVQF